MAQDRTEIIIDNQHYINYFLENFGDVISGKHGPPLPLDETEYLFSELDYPPEGAYTILLNTAGIPIWNAVYLNGGYMMALNVKSVDSSYFYKNTIENLCPNNRYLFYFSSFTLLKNTGDYKIKCVIEGDNYKDSTIFAISDGIFPNAIIGSVGISSSWGFTLPSTETSLTLKLYNIVDESEKCDFVIDQIGIALLTPPIRISTVLGDTTLYLCPDFEHDYKLIGTIDTPGYILPKYQWQIKEANSENWVDILGADSLTYTLTPKLPLGEYNFRLTVESGSTDFIDGCRFYSNTISVKVLHTGVDAGPDKYIVKGTGVTLNGSVNENLKLNYEWIPNYSISNVSSLTPIVYPDIDTIYYLVTKSNDGCSDTDSVSVKVYKDLSIPNVFSPNGDGVNDTWHILQLGDYPNATIDVFNRYGQVVFQSKGYSQEWDGKYKGQALPVGTYYYVIDLKTNIKLQYKGWVEILH